MVQRNSHGLLRNQASRQNFTTEGVTYRPEIERRKDLCALGRVYILK